MITFDQIQIISKYVANSDDAGLSDCLLRILHENVHEDDRALIQQLNRLELFKVLLVLRTVSVGSSVQFKLTNTSDSTTFTLELSRILESIKDFRYDLQEIVLNGIKIVYGLPSTLYVTEDTILPRLIHSITIANQTIYTNDLSDEKLVVIYQSLPSNISNRLLEYITSVTKDTQDVVMMPALEKFGIDAIHLQLFNNSFLKLLSHFYKRDLMSLYQMQYIFVNKLGVSLTELNNMTFAESQTLLNLHNEDTKKQNDEYEKQKSQSSPPSYSKPSMPSMPSLKR